MPEASVFHTGGEERQCQYAPQVNRAVSYVAVLDHIVHLVADVLRSPASTLAAIERLLLTTPTRQRPASHNLRKKLSVFITQERL